MAIQKSDGCSTVSREEGIFPLPLYPKPSTAEISLFTTHALEEQVSPELAQEAADILEFFHQVVRSLRARTSSWATYSRWVRQVLT